MTRFDAVNYISHGFAKAPGRSETRRAQGAEEDDRLEQSARRIFPLHSLTRQPPAVDETKLIAAILRARIILLEDTAADPVGTTVDLYERILAELRARGHGRGADRPKPRRGPRRAALSRLGRFRRYRRTAGGGGDGRRAGGTAHRT